jgi:hypothetical protein
MSFQPTRSAGTIGPMSGRGNARIHIRLVVTAALATVLAAGFAAPATAKKKRPPAVTRAAATPIAPGTQTAATAACPGKTHVTGGGWSLTPAYSANGTQGFGDDSGTRITHLQSQPSGLKSWTAGAAALNLPSTGGTFTALARCESKSLGKTLFGVTGTSTLPVGQEDTIGLHCPKRTHVLSGGFSFSPPGDLADPRGFRAVAVESRRRDARTWEVDVVNPAGAPATATIFTNVLCEVNAKGAGVSERSAVVPIAENSRATATATCTGKTHSIAGGFLTSPTVGPAVGIDQMQPVGAKAWQVGLYEYPRFSLPPGSSLAAYVYCKKNAAPKKRR